MYVHADLHGAPSVIVKNMHSGIYYHVISIIYVSWIDGGRNITLHSLSLTGLF